LLAQLSKPAKAASAKAPAKAPTSAQAKPKAPVAR
jgi:hypothetical protein